MQWSIGIMQYTFSIPFMIQQFESINIVYPMVVNGMLAKSNK